MPRVVVARRSGPVRRRRRWGRSAAALVAAAALALGGTGRFVAAQEQEPPDWYSAGDFGGIGLLQTRTARFSRDGQFDVGVSTIDPYRRIYLTITALPWLEGTFRYTEIRNRLFSNFVEFSGNQTFQDRGADLKFLLARESWLRPAVALGLQDGLGTGLFAGEYLVASKRVRDFDFHLGLGWGYFASDGRFKNPLISLSDGFRTREGASAQGGTAPLGSYFSGERMSLFGGVEYFTPIEGLSLKLEYDANDYQNEPLGNALPATTPINVGFNYRPYSWLEASLGYERGNEIMGRVTLRANFNDPGLPKLDAPPVPLEPRKRAGAAGPSDVEVAAAAAAVARATGVPPAGLPPSAGGDELADSDELFRRVEEAGYEVAAIAISDSAATLDVTGPRSGNSAEVALAALTATPVALDAVTVRETVAGETRIHRYSRDDLVQLGKVDALYAAFEARGVAVEDLSFHGQRVSVSARSTAPISAEVLQEAVREFVASLPVDADEVVLTLERPDGERTEVAYRPVEDLFVGAPETVAAAGAASGEEGTDRGAAEEIIATFPSGEFEVEAVHLTRTTATVFVTPRRFREVARNIGRAARIAATKAPPSVEEITVVQSIGGVQVSRVRLMRRDLERAAVFEGSPEEVWAHAVVEEPTNAIPEDAVRPKGRYPSFRWSIGPRLRQHVGGPDGFYLYQLWAALGARTELRRGLFATALLGFDIYNNFDRLKNTSDSVLPRVRSDIKNYLQEGQNNVVNLRLDYFGMLAPELYYALSGGLLEEMFGGVGGEVLYRPRDSRFAVGFDLHRVRQRTFEQRFEFQDYEVTTGHVNVYYRLPIYDLLVSAHVGQYLAGDIGSSFYLSRTFESGARAGVWATLTNVSPQEFGEGSFDKGFFISIPFQLLTLQSTRQTNTFAFRPLTRDGGQMLAGSKRLYDVTDDGSLDSIARDWPMLME